jgi:hypothetical protein
MWKSVLRFRIRRIQDIHRTTIKKMKTSSKTLPDNWIINLFRTIIRIRLPIPSKTLIAWREAKQLHFMLWEASKQKWRDILIFRLVCRFNNMWFLRCNPGNNRLFDNLLIFTVTFDRRFQLCVNLFGHPARNLLLMNSNWGLSSRS